MTSDPSSSLILFAALLFPVSILATVVTPRVGVPLLLVFLVIGMLAGEVGPGGMYFQVYSLVTLAVLAALAVLLFDRGLLTRIPTFRTFLRPALVLSTSGAPLTLGPTARFH